VVGREGEGPGQRLLEAGRQHQHTHLEGADRVGPRPDLGRHVMSEGQTDRPISNEGQSWQ
jgi:hypothetical protein